MDDIHFLRSICKEKETPVNIQFLCASRITASDICMALYHAQFHSIQLLDTSNINSNRKVVSKWKICPPERGLGLSVEVSLFISSAVVLSALCIFWTVLSPQVDLMHSCYLILCNQCFEKTVTSHFQLNQIKKQLYHRLTQAWMILR